MAEKLSLSVLEEVAIFVVVLKHQWSSETKGGGKQVQLVV